MLLDAALADDIARRRVAVGDLIRHLIGRDLTELAPQVRGHRVQLAVLAARRTIRARRSLHDAHAGELSGALLEVEEHVAIDVLGDHDRVERRLDRGPMDVILHLRDGHASHPGELAELRIVLGAAGPRPHRLPTVELQLDGLEPGRASGGRQAFGALDRLGNRERALIGRATVAGALYVAAAGEQKLGEARGIDRHGVRRAAANQDLAGVVEDLTARSGHIDAAQAVGAGLCAVGLHVENLQGPQTQNQDGDQRGGDQREDHHAAADPVAIELLVARRLHRPWRRRRIGPGWLVGARRAHADPTSGTPITRRRSGRSRMPTSSVVASSVRARMPNVPHATA